VGLDHITLSKIGSSE